MATVIKTDGGVLNIEYQVYRGREYVTENVSQLQGVGDILLTGETIRTYDATASVIDENAINDTTINDKVISQLNPENVDSVIKSDIYGVDSSLISYDSNYELLTISNAVLARYVENNVVYYVPIQLNTLRLDLSDDGLVSVYKNGLLVFQSAFGDVKINNVEITTVDQAQDAIDSIKDAITSGGGGGTGDYLPLTGGTLTGELIGTTGRFNRLLAPNIGSSANQLSITLGNTNTQEYVLNQQAFYGARGKSLGVSSYPWAEAWIDRINNTDFTFKGTGLLYLADDGTWKAQVAQPAYLTFTSRDTFPNPGEVGQLYLAADTGNLYYWNIDDSSYHIVDEGLFTNLVTTDTTQVISGTKTFASNVYINNLYPIGDNLYYLGASDASFAAAYVNNIIPASTLNILGPLRLATANDSGGNSISSVTALYPYNLTTTPTAVIGQATTTGRFGTAYIDKIVMKSGLDYEIDGSGINGLDIKTSSQLSITVDNNNAYRFDVNEFIPYTNSIGNPNLGSLTNKWNDLYLNNELKFGEFMTIDRENVTYREQVITATTNGNTIYVQDSVYAKNMIVAVGTNSLVAISTDGETFNEPTLISETVTNISLLKIIYDQDADLFVAVGRIANDTTAYLFTSPDGITWTDISFQLSDASQVIAHLAYGNGITIVGTSNTGINGRVIYLSANRTSWTERQAEPVTGISTSAILDLQFIEGYFYIVSSSDVLRSANGSSFVRVYSNVSYVKYAISYVNGLIIIGGGSNIIISEDNGETWRTQNITGNTYYVTYSDKDKLYIAGNVRSISGNTQGVLIESEDLITWRVLAQGSNTRAQSKGIYAFDKFIHIGAYNIHIIENKESIFNIPNLTLNGNKILTTATGLYYDVNNNITLRDGTKITGRSKLGGINHEIFGVNDYTDSFGAFDQLEIGSQSALLNANIVYDANRTQGHLTADVYNEDGSYRGKEVIAYISDLTSSEGDYLPLAGGTMSGDIVMALSSIRFGGAAATGNRIYYDEATILDVSGTFEGFNIVTGTKLAKYNGVEIATKNDIPASKTLARAENVNTNAVQLPANADVVNVVYNNISLLSSKYSIDSSNILTITDTSIATAFDDTDIIEVTYYS